MTFTVFSRTDSFSDQICDRISADLESLDGFSRDDQNPDLIICVGGDGTLLRAIHRYLHIVDHALFVGVHTGTLGFFTDYVADELSEFLEAVRAGCYSIETSSLLEISTDQDDQTYYALNEFRIGSFLRTVAYDVFIDGEFFEHTNGSGVCISTQAGSTAISRALGGAVVDDGLDVLQLCEIMPISHKSHHSLRNPYIMRADRVVQIRGSSIAGSEAVYDHKELDVGKASQITVRTSERKVRFARYKPYSYLKRLRNLY